MPKFNLFFLASFCIVAVLNSKKNSASGLIDPFVTQLAERISKLNQVLEREPELKDYINYLSQGKSIRAYRSRLFDQLSNDQKKEILALILECVKGKGELFLEGIDFLIAGILAGRSETGRKTTIVEYINFVNGATSNTIPIKCQWSIKNLTNDEQKNFKTKLINFQEGKGSLFTKFTKALVIKCLDTKTNEEKASKVNNYLEHLKKGTYKSQNGLDECEVSLKSISKVDKVALLEFFPCYLKISEAKNSLENCLKNLASQEKTKKITSILNHINKDPRECEVHTECGLTLDNFDNFDRAQIFDFLNRKLASQN